MTGCSGAPPRRRLQNGDVGAKIPHDVDDGDGGPPAGDDRRPTGPEGRSP